MSDKTKKLDDGGPAYPTLVPTGAWSEVVDVESRSITEVADMVDRPGMSLRDWFAAQAMNGLLHGTIIDRKPWEALIAEMAYELADTMIAEKRRREQA